MNRFTLSVITLLVAGAFAWWWFTPTQVLKRRTRKILHVLTLEAASGRTNRQMGIYTLNALLAPQVEFKTPTPAEANGIFDRSEIESTFSWLCDQAKQSRFELHEVRSIHINGDQAEVAFAMDALVELPDSMPIDGRYEVTFHWQKVTDTWHLSRATWAVAGEK